jgi:hypothetical protein
VLTYMCIRGMFQTAACNACLGKMFSVVIWQLLVYVGCSYLEAGGVDDWLWNSVNCCM